MSGIGAAVGPLRNQPGDSPLPEDYQPFVRGILRVALYAGITAFLFLLMYVDAVTTGTFGETSLVEIAQSVTLFVITAIFVSCALRISALTRSAWLLATFVAASLIRENDIWLDMLHEEGWQISVTPVIAAGLFYTFRHRAAFLAEQKAFTESTAFGLFVGSLLTTYVFSRLFGMGRFWQAVMQDDYLRPIKDMSEECLELFGYGLMLCAAIEFVALARRLAAETGRPALAPRAA